MPPRPTPPKIRGLYLKHGLYVYQPPMKEGRRPKPVHLSTADFAEAIRQVDAIQKRVHFHRITEPLADAVETYLAAKRGQGDHKGRATTHSAVCALNQFQKFFKCAPAAITPAAIREWKAAMLAAGLSRASAAGYMRYAQSFLSWLVREGRLAENPFQGQKGLFPKSIPTRRDRACDKATRDRLIADCDYLPLKAVLFLGFHAGLRRNEILNVRPDWIIRGPNGRPTHLEIRNESDGAGGLAFAAKDSENRIVPVSTPLADFLADEYGTHHRPFLIRPDLTPGRHVYRWEWRRRWAAYMKAQGAEWVTPHTLRHTWFSLLLSAPTDRRPSLLHLERWSGTNTETIKKHYAHLFEDSDLINAAN